ncbi:MAG: hypothetical protein M1830_004218, partial [Pleopsidium flavum]
MADVFDFAGTGKLTGVNNTWELLAWGEDTCGEGYMVIYETAVAASGSPAGLDIESRVEGGPSAETLKAILSAVRRLGGGELRGLAGEVKKVPENGARRGQLPVVCDEGCREN